MVVGNVGSTDSCRDGYAERFYAERFLLRTVFRRRHFLPIGLFVNSFMPGILQRENLWKEFIATTVALLKTGQTTFQMKH